MKTKSSAFGLFAAVLVGSWGTAGAVTLRIDAVSTDPNGVGFDVVFEDTGDGLLQYEDRKSVV